MRMRAWTTTPSVVPMPRIKTCDEVSTPSAAAEVPATEMKSRNVAMATTLFAIGANMGAPN